MKRNVMGFFVLLFLFVLAIAFIAFNQTGKLTNITGYSVAVEEEKYDKGVYGTVLSGMILGFVFLYIVKFIFESYDRKSSETKFKRVIDLNLS